MGSTQTSRPRQAPRRGAAGLIFVGALALAACGGSDDAGDSAAPAAGESTAEEARAEEGAGGASFIATDDTGDAAASDRPSQGEGGFDIGVIGRDVIIEMRVVVSSDDIQRTVASIMASASTLGGGVASSDVNYGSGDVGTEGYAVLVVKVPPASVDRLLAGLDDTGTIQSINQSAQDVTEQLVDLDVRIQNARQSVANVREFMDRTENLNELVTLEGELTRRQTELEQLEARQRNLTDRVALSTVTIEVVPTASVPEPPADEDETIADAFRSGWEAFVAVVFGIGYILAATLPFLISGLLIAMAVWGIVRRRDSRREAPRSMPPAMSTPPTNLPVDPAGDPEADRETEPVG